MKKVFYLVLMLMVLSVASVNAQVRIGGSTDPYGSAVLDLNANDDATPAANKGGLSFPRISLDTTNVKLNGVTPKEGTVVYNTNPSMKGGLGTGIYMWTGTKWNSLVASVPVTSITLAPKDTVNIQVSSTVPIAATVAPVNASNQLVNWSSSTPAVATVNANGSVRGVAVGTSTVTATANDGSGKKATLLANVFANGLGKDTVGTRVYDVYTFPNGLGTWMWSDNREGVADTTKNGYSFYSWQHASAACVAPWVLPTSDQWQALTSFLLKSPPLMVEFLTSLYVIDWNGKFTPSGVWYRPNDTKYYWTSTETGSGKAYDRGFYAGDPIRTQPNDENKQVFMSVRCVRF